MPTSKLNIVHVGHVGDKPYSGVATVVPKYLQYQAPHANVAFLNLFDYEPDNSQGNYPTYIYGGDGLAKLPSPFAQPDLVVFHEVYRPKFVEIARWLVKNNIPYIITPHVSLTDTAQKHKRLKKIAGNMLMFNWFIKHAKSIHYLSDSEKDQSTSYNKLPYFICGNGIEIKGRLKKSFSKTGLSLVYVGRLEYLIKGIDRILEMANVLKRQGVEDITFNIYGVDESNNLLKINKYIEEHELGDIVKVGQGVYGEEKIKTILKHDCFIQLSRTEGQPLSIMEAMDIGMPCVVTEGTTFFDIANRYNVGIPVSDKPTDIARAILGTKKSKSDLSILSLDASNYAEKHFSWNEVALSEISQYDQTLRGVKI